MKYLLLISFTIAVCFITGCASKKQPGKDYLLVENAMLSGEFSRAKYLADSLKSEMNADTIVLQKIDSLLDMMHRISHDFSLTETAMVEKLKATIGEYSEEERVNWELQNWLEWRIIDDEKRYFKRAVSNLKLILAHKNLKPGALATDDFDLFKISRARQVLGRTRQNGDTVMPVALHIKYRITVDADAVPPGETIRCWMPWPHESHFRQQQIKLLSSFPAILTIAPDSVGQRSAYMEQPAVSGQPAIFEIEFTYRAYAQYFNTEASQAVPYDKSTLLYNKFTAEQAPHLLFTERIKQLSDTIVGDTTNPREIVRRIFYWIDRNIPWAGALEYGIMPNIPQYVMENMHGDCGMKTLLFMTLARYNGIPVKWQSGWMMHPGEVNLHDWCEVYYEGLGWVPLDMSFGLLPSENRAEREFYMTGIDAYRLIVNDAISTKFFPPKQFRRSEPVDFQRGEVEWSGGNLYFDKWNYSMKVQYLK